MAKNHSKTNARLRKTVIRQQRQFTQYKQALNAKLARIEDELGNVLHSHLFYQQAILALTEESAEPEYWLMGALHTHRWLRQSGEQLINQITDTRQRLRH